MSKAMLKGIRDLILILKVKIMMVSGLNREIS